MKKVTKKIDLKKKYALDTYKGNHNSVPVTYNGVTYKSKVQCMVLNNLTCKELDEYLKNNG